MHSWSWVPEPKDGQAGWDWYNKWHKIKVNDHKRAMHQGRLKAEAKGEKINDDLMDDQIDILRDVAKEVKEDVEKSGERIKTLLEYQALIQEWAKEFIEASGRTAIGTIIGTHVPNSGVFFPEGGIGIGPGAVGIGGMPGVGRGPGGPGALGGARGGARGGRSK